MMTSKRPWLATALIVLPLVAGFVAKAHAINSNNVTGNWSVGSTWVGGIAPVTPDVARVTGNSAVVTYDGPANAGPFSDVYVDSGGQLFMTKDFSSASYFNVETGGVADFQGNDLTTVSFLRASGGGVATIINIGNLTAGGNITYDNGGGHLISLQSGTVGGSVQMSSGNQTLAITQPNGAIVGLAAGGWSIDAGDMVNLSFDSVASAPNPDWAMRGPAGLEATWETYIGSRIFITAPVSQTAAQWVWESGGFTYIGYQTGLEAAAVPEPTALSLAAACLAGIVLLAWVKRGSCIGR